MTNEEVKKELSKLIFELGFEDNVDDRVCALNMAIQALSQEPLCDHDCEHCTWTECPIEPCTDAVSRQAVENITWEEPSYTDALNVLTEVRDKVRELPSVNPQPCDDAISREAVLDTTICEGISCNECSFNELDGNSPTGCLLHARILELPSVTQKSGKWINVNDMLPREREDVLVTCFVHENWQTKIGYWNGKAWVVNAYDILFIDRLEVIAWMPLPQPY